MALGGGYPPSVGNKPYHEGDGTRRTVRFIEAMDLTILSGRRHMPMLRPDSGEPDVFVANRSHVIPEIDN